MKNKRVSPGKGISKPTRWASCDELALLSKQLEGPTRRTIPIFNLSVCEDPLCGVERYGVAVRSTKTGLILFEFHCVEPTSPLTADGIFRIGNFNSVTLTLFDLIGYLNRNGWMGSDIPIETAKGNSPFRRLLDGPNRLFQIESNFPEIQNSFRRWVREVWVNL
jgi:hypothetical protein